MKPESGQPMECNLLLLLPIAVKETAPKDETSPRSHHFQKISSFYRFIFGQFTREIESKIWHSHFLAYARKINASHDVFVKINIE